MPRKPRIQFAGAIYHVFNRGGGRRELFAAAAVAQIFVDCLLAASERMGWRLHAYGLLRDEYHLALTTQRPNLAAGLHWLQSAFRNRRDARSGPVFRARYRAILVEPGAPLARVVEHIHLSPVRAKIVTFEQLAQFRWSSFRYFVRGAEGRPPALACGEWLDAPGGGTDSPEGWRGYTGRLAAALAAPSRDTAAEGGSIGRGWFYGSEEFRRRVLARREPVAVVRGWCREDDARAQRDEWRQALAQAATAIGFDFSTAAVTAKAAAPKVALAAWLKQHTGATNRWLTEALHMGPPDAVSRYVTELRLGRRPAARERFAQLAAAGGAGQVAGGAPKCA